MASHWPRSEDFLKDYKEPPNLKLRDPGEFFLSEIEPQRFITKGTARTGERMPASERNRRPSGGTDEA